MITEGQLVGNYYGDPENVYIKPVNWLNGEYGLFAKRDIIKNTIITEYAGTIRYVQHDMMNTHAITLFFNTGISNERCVIDGFRQPKVGYGSLQFANHSTKLSNKNDRLDHRKI